MHYMELWLQLLSRGNRLGSQHLSSYFSVLLSPTRTAVLKKERMKIIKNLTKSYGGMTDTSRADTDLLRIILPCLSWSAPHRRDWYRLYTHSTALSCWHWSDSGQILTALSDTDLHHTALSDTDLFHTALSDTDLLHTALSDTDLNPVWYWPAPHSPVWYWPALHIPVWYWPALHSPVWYWPALHSPVWYWPAPHSPVWYWPALHSPVWYWPAPHIHV